MTVNQQEALKIAIEFSWVLYRSAPDVLVPSTTEPVAETEFAWIWSFCDKKLLETGDEKYELIGSGFVLVRKSDGKPEHLMWSGQSMDDLMLKWEKKNRLKRSIHPQKNPLDRSTSSGFMINEASAFRRALNQLFRRRP